MQRIKFSCVLGGLLLTGCSQGSAPEQSQSPSPSADASSTRSAQAMPAAGPSASSVDNIGGQVELDAITLTAPAGWQRKPPASPILAAEFVLPRSEGDDADGRLTVSMAGGSVEANIDRWKSQFQPQPEETSQTEVDVAGLTATVVDFSGDFNDRRGPFAPAVLRPDFRMIAAIIPVNGQLHFIKATGPAQTIADRAEELDQFIRSVQPRR